MDDMDELEEALRQRDITQEQFDLAIRTVDELKNRLLCDIDSFRTYTNKCYDIVRKSTGRRQWHPAADLAEKR